MRVTVLILVTILASCTAPAPKTPRTPERHAANLAAASQAGYRVVTNGERTTFCPIALPTGSHMAASCLSESQFESLLGAPRSMSSAAHYTNTPTGPGANAGH